MFNKVEECQNGPCILRYFCLRPSEEKSLDTPALKYLHMPYIAPTRKTCVRLVILYRSVVMEHLPTTVQTYNISIGSNTGWKGNTAGLGPHTGSQPQFIKTGCLGFA